MHIRAYVRRRSRAKALSRKASLRPLSLCDSPFPEKITSDKRDPIYRQTLIDFGYDALQPPKKVHAPENARTVAYSTDCWAPESVRWVPQIRQANEFTQSLLAPTQPDPAVKKKSSTFSRLVYPITPISERWKESESSRRASLALQSSTTGLVRNRFGDDRPRSEKTSAIPSPASHVVDVQPVQPLNILSSTSSSPKKTRRKPPPLMQQGSSGHKHSQSTDSDSQSDASLFNASGDGGERELPVITITEVTQTLLMPPKAERWVNKSPSRSDSTFPTSPSPSDLGLASPLSSSLDSDNTSSTSSRRRDSMAPVLGTLVGVPRPDITEPRLVVVVNMYLPTLNDELAVRRGEMLHLLKKYKDGWCAVERPKTGEKGVIPRFCVEELPLVSRRRTSGSSHGSTTETPGPIRF